MWSIHSSHQAKQPNCLDVNNNTSKNGKTFFNVQIESEITSFTKSFGKEI